MPKKSSSTSLSFNSYFLNPLYRLILMSTFVLCVGWGTPLYGFLPCQWCTYESCGNDLRDGFCALCNSRNSCVYDPNPNSFDCPPDSYHPPYPAYETYSCDSYGNDSHFVMIVSPNCGVLPEANHCQPPQYTINHPIFNAHNDLLNANNDLLNSRYKITIAQNELMEQLTSMCAMQIEDEQAANARYWKIPACCDDDDDSAIIPNEPVDSLSMGDEHFNTILATKSDEFIKSCVENLVPNPSESEAESECDMPAHVPEKFFSNPLFEEEIIPIKIDQHHDNAESTHDSSLIISSKIYSPLDEFVGEITLLKSIPPGIDKTDCHPEIEIRFTKRLLYDNSSPRPPKEFISNNSDADIESFSPSPIRVEDSDSFIEEIDLSFNSDDPMPPGIEEDDDDSEKDMLIHEELFDNYSLSLPVIDSFYFDIPSFSRPPAKPPDGNIGILNIKIMGDNFERKVPIPELTITRISNQEKSSDLLSHRSFENFQLSAKRPMMIHEKNILILDVPLFHFYPLDQFKYGGNWVKLSDLKQALRGRHPMLMSSLIFLFCS
nr:hypothetical protein [Tanacetum cinerariifolium]